MYRSLSLYYDKFTLWILCMDDLTYETLREMNLPNVRLIKLNQFEDFELLTVKFTRSFGEYCWTCTSSLLIYLFKKYPKTNLLTYLDADLFFFSSPEVIFKEFGNKSFFLIPHRHSVQYQHLEKVHGKFNVAFLIFKRDKNAFTCLRYWRKQSLEWCYNRRENNRYGDQLYFDDYAKRFKGVYICKNIGADVAPWNVNSYKITRTGDKIMVDSFPLIFYHFANLRMMPGFRFKSLPKDTLFAIPESVEKIIYQYYFKELTSTIKWVQQYLPDFKEGITY